MKKSKNEETQKKKPKKKQNNMGIGEWAEVEGELSEDTDSDEEVDEQNLELAEDPLSDSDEGGEWITPENVDKHLTG